MLKASHPALRCNADCSSLDQLLKAVKKRPGCTRSQIDQEAVLLRAYGKGTDVLIDRESEQRSDLYMGLR